MSLPILEDGPFRYAWVDNWATIPDSALGRVNGRTHGVVVANDGRVIVFHQADPAVLVFDPNGSLMDSWGSWPGAHGMTLVTEGPDEFLLLTDEFDGRAQKMTLEGESVLEIKRPDHPVYQRTDLAKGRSSYKPTWAAQNPDNGDIWVGDGYGSFLVHRHDRHGNYLMTLDGTEGMGRFDQPHGIAFNPRAKTPELYVTDRANGRVQIFDGAGRYLRGFAHAPLVHPCMFAFCGEYLVIPELFASISILDGSDQLVATLGDNLRGICRPEGTTLSGMRFETERDDHIRWDEGYPDWLQNRHEIKPGLFNSPHCAAMASNGDIYVTEWVIGGRITKLKQLD